MGAVLAVAANLVHPRRIPWMQDWSGQVEARAAKMGISVAPLLTVREKFENREVLFIDARSAFAFAEGHIPGAVSIPFDALDESLETIIGLIGSGREVVVYCTDRKCDDALLLANELKAMGASKLVLYVDGYANWKRSGGPVSEGVK